MASTKFPLLSKYGYNLTPTVQQQDVHLHNPNSLVDRTIQVLSRQVVNHPVLVCSDKVKKITHVENVARLIISGNVPSQLRGKQIFSLDNEKFFDGIIETDNLNKRMNTIIEALKASDGQIIMYIDDAHRFMGMCEEYTDWGYGLLYLPARRGKIRLITGINETMLKNCVEPHQNLNLTVMRTKVYLD